MKWFRHSDPILSLYGPINDRFERMPAYLSDVSEKMAGKYRRTPGGRIRFMTDSPSITLELYDISAQSYGRNLSLLSACAADCYAGTGRDARFLGLCAPDSADQRFVSVSFSKNREGMELITVMLPVRAQFSQVRIGVEDSASVLPAPPYTVDPPIVFYGSSITEGFCASRPSMNYVAKVCRWLDADFRNYGFAGGARGETPVAEYLARQPMSVFVYDYDHNAPDPTYLAKTHEPFFRIIREKNPDVPILMLSRPDVFLYPEDSAARRDVVRKTYQNALAAGDRNVWFIDGHTLFEGEESSFCTIDGCHPTDLGFDRMARKVYPVLLEMLQKSPR